MTRSSISGSDEHHPAVAVAVVGDRQGGAGLLDGQLEQVCSSSEAAANRCPEAGLKQTAACPVDRVPADASRVMAAPVTPNRASSFGCFGLLRPSRASRNFTPAGRAAASSWASCSRRRSRGGWVANSDEKLNPGASAGAKKKAFSGSAARRSRVGIRPMSPVILTRAEASSDGRPIRIAPARSADSSR